jgi:hypothetical protein
MLINARILGPVFKEEIEKELLILRVINNYNYYINVVNRAN